MEIIKNAAGAVIGSVFEPVLSYIIMLLYDQWESPLDDFNAMSEVCFYIFRMFSLMSNEFNIPLYNISLHIFDINKKAGNVIRVV